MTKFKKFIILYGTPFLGSALLLLSVIGFLLSMELVAAIFLWLAFAERSVIGVGLHTTAKQLISVQEIIKSQDFQKLFSSFGNEQKNE